jgi:hypothetical protein
LHAASIRLLAALALIALACVLVWPRPQPHAVTWEEMIAPYSSGTPLPGGYVLLAPRRGEERDVVFLASDPSGHRVQVHVVPKGQWTGVIESRSFGIAYEAPQSPAPEADRQAVTAALAEAIRGHDTGFTGTGVIGLQSETRSTMAVSVATLSSWQGIGAAACALGVVWLLLSLRAGAWIAAAALFALSLLVRLPALGLPFEHDQDVQRMFTGHLPLWEVLTGAGLNDRHPPLYFVVLHVAQWFGQSEAVGRAPAAFAGALIAPAILLLARWTRPPASGRGLWGAAVLALVAALTPALILRSREVSEIPLFALLVLISCAAVARGTWCADRRTRVAIAVSQALMLWTYYLGVFVVVGQLAAAAAARKLDKAMLRATGLGLLLGSPALALAVITAMRDRGAREAARTMPALAWGQHTVGELARAQLTSALTGIGLFLFVFLAAAAMAAFRRQTAAIVTAGAAIATFCGIAMLAPFARMQPYYVSTVLPACLFAIALALEGGRRYPGIHAAAVALVAILFAKDTVGSLSQSGPLYEPAANAVMPSVAKLIREHPHPVVAVTAHYDATILVYYLARQAGVEMDWQGLNLTEDGMHPEGLAFRIVPIVQVHQAGLSADADAVRALDKAGSQGAFLVVARAMPELRLLSQRVESCELLLAEQSVQVRRCAR